jgi:membrane-bound lytic murein transglycosylase D
VDILNQYKTSRFGFAARNYYAEFLAALDVYKSAPFIFQGKKPIEHWDYEVLVLPVAAYLRDLVLPQAVDQDWLQRYNPALTKEARLGREVLPAGFTLRIPPGTKDKVGARLSMLSAQEKAKAQDHVRGRHRANGKQRIFDIAKTYDVFHDQLAKRLGYAAHDKPKNGSVILLRSADSRFTELPSAVYRPGQQMVEPDKENSVAAAP